jgi:hypothetical protein
MGFQVFANILSRPVPCRDSDGVHHDHNNATEAKEPSDAQCEDPRVKDGKQEETHSDKYSGGNHREIWIVSSGVDRKGGILRFLETNRVDPP